MVDFEKQFAEPLLGELTTAQAECLAVIGEIVQRHRAWPVFQYVEARLDRRGLDAASVIASFPAMAHGQFSYALVRTASGFHPGQRVELTVAGLHRLAPAAGLATMYLRVLAGIAEASAAVDYDPLKATAVWVDGAEIVARLGLGAHPFLDLLPDLVQHEPGTMHGAQSRATPTEWSHRPESFIRRFRGVTDVPDYLARVRAWQIPADPTPVPTTSTPLGLAAALDYLNLVWRTSFGTALVRLPNAERVTRLAFDARTEAEFVGRLGSLREILDCLDVGGLRCGVEQIPAFLSSKVPLESSAELRINGAVDTLRTVARVGDATRDASVAGRTAGDLRRLGLSYPIADYAQAWRCVTAHVLDALRVLREEVESATHVHPVTPGWSLTQRSALIPGP